MLSVIFLLIFQREINIISMKLKIAGVQGVEAGGGGAGAEDERGGGLVEEERADAELEEEDLARGRGG